MTKNIKVLNKHLVHWERLLLEGICDKTEGEDIIEALKTAIENERRLETAEWVRHDTYYDCSVCGCLPPSFETIDSIVWKLSNFCPDCGRKMKYKSKEKENE